MLLKILVVGALLIGAMAVIRNGTVLRNAGLLSRCQAVTVDGKSDPTMLSCSKGRLDGFPDMSTKSCQLISAHAHNQYWRCDAPVVSSQTGKG
ncbi:MAG TPA: hypothetical protein VFM43_09020 [Gaiellaceae bacterium]|nr:hypothetical protein [Gaiellaceae bacterium]